jgi:molybdopterin-guanine dinucleotide biosynthesis protein
MRPFLIGVGGAHSDSGKTTVACAVLAALPGWGAIKCEPTALYTSIVADDETLSRPDKDTGKYLRAGAEDVLWVRAPREELEETLEMALGRLSRLPGIVVEGNSAIEVLRPDIVIFISEEPQKIKKSALAVLGMADIVLYGSEPPAEAPGGCRIFHRDDREGYVGCLTGMVHERRA